MFKGQKSRVYTDCIVGWEDATLIDRYEIIEENFLERWRIKTSTGTYLVRYTKNCTDIKEDGCAYIGV